MQLKGSDLFGAERSWEAQACTRFARGGRWYSLSAQIELKAALSVQEENKSPAQLTKKGGGGDNAVPCNGASTNKINYRAHIQKCLVCSRRRKKESCLKSASAASKILLQSVARRCSKDKNKTAQHKSHRKVAAQSTVISFHVFKAQAMR